MSANKVDDLILNAAENADKMKNVMNKKEAVKYKESYGHELETTFKAMLYYQLIKNGLEYWKISMENSPEAKDNSDIELKRIDIWIDEENVDYLLEVKLVGVHEKTKGLRRVNNKDGLYGDLLKLTEIVKYFKDESTFGIAIAVYDGHDDSIDCEYIESKLKPEVKGILTRQVKMMICANGKCEYVKN